MPDWSKFGNPDDVLLTDPNVPDVFKVCVLQGVVAAHPEFSGDIGARIGSIFVIGIVSTFVTVFPLLSQKYKWKLSVWFYLFAKYFGAGVILATAFVHLLDPAFNEIGLNSCVGMWGNWSLFTWVSALVLVALFGTFLIDLLSEVYVERKYGYYELEVDIQKLLTIKEENENNLPPDNETGRIATLLETAELDDSDDQNSNQVDALEKEDDKCDQKSIATSTAPYEFKQQFAAFIILEAGIIFHSVIIGLNLGSCNEHDFKSLYVVLVFHQSFEGLGIGARLSAIPWPKDKGEYLKYLLCLAYGLVTPISIAIGLGIRTTYVAGGFTATVISGVLDALSAGVLIYTALVDFMARDFIFNKEIKHNLVELFYSLFCFALGTGVMSVIGKWA